MNAAGLLARFEARLEACAGLRWQGRVRQVIGPMVEASGPFCSVGGICEIQSSGGRSLRGEIVGFRDSTVLAMPLESPHGVRPGDRIVAWGERASLAVGADMLGRVLDG